MEEIFVGRIFRDFVIFWTLAKVYVRVIVFDDILEKKVKIPGKI